MKLILNLILLILIACSKPTAHVYQDATVASQSTLKFCLLGGVGQGSLIQQAVADSLGKEKCDQVYFLGDLLAGPPITSLEDPDFIDKFLTYYQPLLDSAQVSKIHLLLGENEYLGDPSLWLGIENKYPGFFFPNYYYMTNYGGLCIISIDSNVLTRSEYAETGLKQIAWISSLQSELKNCKIKVALSHHPYKGNKLEAGKAISWEGSKGTLRLFLDTYVIGKMDLHVSAHLETVAEDGTDEETKLLVSGAGGEVRTLTDEPGFVVLVWNAESPDKISYKLKKLARPPLNSDLD